jgi:hypothetical protein
VSAAAKPNTLHRACSRLDAPTAMAETASRLFTRGLLESREKGPRLTFRFCSSGGLTLVPVERLGGQPRIFFSLLIGESRLTFRVYASNSARLSDRESPQQKVEAR